MKKFVIGAILGACAALLMAPQSGAQTRSQIRDKASKLGNDMSDFADKKGRHWSNKVKGYKHKMMQMAESLRHRAEKEMAATDAGV